MGVEGGGWWAFVEPAAVFLYSYVSVTDPKSLRNVRRRDSGQKTLGGW